MALEDFLDLLGERRLSGRMGPSRTLAELQEDVDPETGAYNDPYLDTISGEPIDPTLFRDEIDVAGLAEGYEPAITDTNRPRPMTGMNAPPITEPGALVPNIPSPTEKPPEIGASVAPPLIDTSSLPTGSVKNLPVGLNQRNYPETLREDQIQGPPAGSEADATIEEDHLDRILRALSATASDMTGGLVGTRPESYGEQPLITKIAPLVLGGGAAVQGARAAAPAIARGGNQLLEWFRMMQGLGRRGAGSASGPARIGQQRALPTPSATNRPPGYTPPGSGRPISKPSPGNPPGRRATRGTVPVLQ